MTETTPSHLFLLVCLGTGQGQGLLSLVYYFMQYLSDSIIADHIWCPKSLFFQIFFKWLYF